MAAGFLPPGNTPVALPVQASSAWTRSGKSTQATQRESGARQRAKEAHLAASWALIGFFLDPVLFEMLPTAKVVESAKWLVRALLTADPGAVPPALPEWIELGEALPGGSQSPGWLLSCAEEPHARIADWLVMQLDKAKTSIF